MAGAAAIAALMIAAACPENVTVAIVPSVAGTYEPSANAIFEMGRRAIGERVCVEARTSDRTLEQLTDRCGSDQRCIDEVIAGAGVRAVLLVIVVRTKNRWLLSARWHAEGRPPNVATDAIDTENAAGIERALAPLIARLLDEAGVVRGGRLALSVEPADAKVVVRSEGQDLEFAPDVLLPAGRYTLELAAIDHQPEVRAFEIAPGQTVNLHLALERVPFVYERWWFWTAIGAAALGGALAVGLALRSGDACLCSASSAERCAMLCEGR